MKEVVAPEPLVIELHSLSPVAGVTPLETSDGGFWCAAGAFEFDCC